MRPFGPGPLGRSRLGPYSEPTVINLTRWASGLKFPLESDAGRSDQWPHHGPSRPVGMFLSRLRMDKIGGPRQRSLPGWALPRAADYRLDRRRSGLPQDSTGVTSIDDSGSAGFRQASGGIRTPAMRMSTRRLALCFPAGGGADAGDAGQGAEQVERVDVEADGAAGDRAIDERMRSPP